MADTKSVFLPWGGFGAAQWEDGGLQLEPFDYHC